MSKKSKQADLQPIEIGSFRVKPQFTKYIDLAKPKSGAPPFFNFLIYFIFFFAGN